MNLIVSAVRQWTDYGAMTSVSVSLARNLGTTCGLTWFLLVRVPMLTQLCLRIEPVLCAMALRPSRGRIQPEGGMRDLIVRRFLGVRMDDHTRLM